MLIYFKMEDNMMTYFEFIFNCNVFIFDFDVEMFTTIGYDLVLFIMRLQ